MIHNRFSYHSHSTNGLVLSNFSANTTNGQCLYLINKRSGPNTSFLGILVGLKLGDDVRMVVCGGAMGLKIGLVGILVVGLN